MRRFGRGEGSALPISLVSGVVIIAVCWTVYALRLAPHLFLPTPTEVMTAAVATSRDGYPKRHLSVLGRKRSPSPGAGMPVSTDRSFRTDGAIRIFALGVIESRAPSAFVLQPPPGAEEARTALFCWISKLSIGFVYGFELATPAGLEPATCRLEGGCSIQLSYGAERT
jgi:hypothetical protein